MTKRIHQLAPAALAASIVLSATGQLFMKAGMQALQSALAAQPIDYGSAAMLSSLAWTISGLASYACSLVVWLFVLARYPLSFAYPLLGLSYVLVYAGATFWPRLAEPASVPRTVGTLLILVGVALVSLSRPDRSDSE
jgi:undecaprenyl phosphate-alpha-L-ara4N flippase subunit ArnF